jgi:hypothetical protein
MTLNLERRRHNRIAAVLPLRLIAVAGRVEPSPVTLLTLNISKAGVCFPAPRRIDPGEFVEVEITLTGLGPNREDVRISNVGRVVRVEAGEKHGRYYLAAAFDELSSGGERDWHKLLTVFDQQNQPPKQCKSLRELIVSSATVGQC